MGDAENGARDYTARQRRHDSAPIAGSYYGNLMREFVVGACCRHMLWDSVVGAGFSPRPNGGEGRWPFHRGLKPRSHEGAHIPCREGFGVPRAHRIPEWGGGTRWWERGFTRDRAAVRGGGRFVAG